MGIKQLYNDNLRTLSHEYGDISVMAGIFTQRYNSLLKTVKSTLTIHRSILICFVPGQV